MEAEMVLSFLHKLEKEHDIKILYAVNGGSMSMGYASPESDTDVRFIYVHRPEYYFSITPKPDTINYMSDDHDLDLVGFELRKALSMLMKTNPIESDWLHSDVVYIEAEGFRSKMLEFEKMYYNPTHAMYHFRSISVKHNDRYFQEKVTLKRFIYYMRGFLSCIWIEKNYCHPPVIIDDLIDAVIDDSEIRELAHGILATKRSGSTHNDDPVDERLVEHMNAIREHIESILPTFRPDKPEGKKELLTLFLMECSNKAYIHK